MMLRKASYPRKEAGAVAVFFAISLVATITCVMLVIDLGRLYYAHRELDKAANLAALSAVEIASGCQGVKASGVQANLSAVRAAAESSILANGGVSAWMTGIHGSPAVEMGRTVSTGDGLRTLQPLTPGDPRIDSVRVTISRPMPKPLMPFHVAGDGTLVSSSTARQSVVGSFNVSSSLLNLNTANSALLNGLLSGLLGGSVNLSVADYRALAGVNVSLEAIATSIDVEVKDLSDVLDADVTTPLPDMIDGLVSGLGSSASSTVAQILRSLAGAAQHKQVPLGEILTPITDTVAAVPFINLLDLIIALGTAASSDASGNAAPIALPLNVTIPGVLRSAVYLQVMEPPQIGIGRPGEARAKTAAVKLAVRVDADTLLTSLQSTVNGLLSGILNTVTGLLRLVTLGLVNIEVDGPNLIPHLKIGIDVNVGQAEARLDTVSCPTRNNPALLSELSASPAVANVQVGSYNGSPSASYLPPLSSTAPAFDVLNLGLKVKSPINLGTLNLDVALDMTCVSVGAQCYGAGEPHAAPFRPLPRIIDRFTQVLPQVGSPYALADGHLGGAPLPGINPQTVGSNLDLSLSLNTRQPITSGTGVLGGLAYVLNGLVSAVVNLLNPLLNFVGGLLNATILPLLNLLGIQLGEATVTMNTVTIDRPVVVTTCIPGAVAPYGCPAV